MKARLVFLFLKIRTYLYFNSRFQNGFFVLSLLLCTSFFIYFKSFYTLEQGDSDGLVAVDFYQQQIDSLKKVAISQKNTPQYKPFNPNFITEYKAYRLGLPADAFGRLQNYRASGSWINSVSDFKKVTAVPDSIVQKISPLFKFPRWTQSRSKSKKRTATYTGPKKGLNRATASDLEQTLGIPDFIAHKIIKYRDKIGGFVNMYQIQDIQGLYASQQKKLVARYTLLHPKKVKKIDINTASVQSLLSVPYFDFDLALAIRDYISENGALSDFSELANLPDFPYEKIKIIALYLRIK